MKAKPYKFIGAEYIPCEPSEASHILLHFPGPFYSRMLPIILHGKREGTPCWSWNGDTEKPTLKPSILTKGGLDSKERCHSFVNDGKIQFLSDCSHEFAGKIVDLLDID